MTTVSLAGAWLANERWTVIAAAGVILDGTLVQATGPAHDVEPGGTAAVGMEYRAQAGTGRIPFIDLSMTLGASWASTVARPSGPETDYFASDLRLGARAGWSVRGGAFPYVAARVFGGPVQWELAGEDVTGSDKHHYQLALGAAIPVGPVGIFAEWAGVGERSVSVGMSAAW